MQQHIFSCSMYFVTLFCGGVVWTSVLVGDEGTQAEDEDSLPGAGAGTLRRISLGISVLLGFGTKALVQKSCR